MVSGDAERDIAPSEFGGTRALKYVPLLLSWIGAAWLVVAFGLTVFFILFALAWRDAHRDFDVGMQPLLRSQLLYR